MATLSVPSQYTTIQDAINAASNGDIIEVTAGTYNEQVLVNKSITINGAQKDISAIKNDGSIRNTINTDESVVQGNNVGSGVCFTITANNVVINGFKCILPASSLVRDAFNLKLTPAGAGNTSTLENIVIKNNIIQNLRASGQSQSILFGESTTGVNNASNGDGVWNNVEIANNYFDCSTAGNGYRGVQFSTHFKIVNYSNINIHDNRFVHSVNITGNRAIGVTSYISLADRGPTYLNNFKIKNNYFNTPGNSSIGGFFDCDRNCEISNNTFMNCKFGISSINFREVGGKILNNTFNVTDYAIGINDNWYATTNGEDITISGNNFISNSLKHIECASQNVNFSNLQLNNIFNGYVLKSAESTYRQFDNASNPLLIRVTRSIYPTIQKGIDAIGIEVIEVGAGTYNHTSTLVINKEVTITGTGYNTIISFNSTPVTGIQINANNVTLKSCFVKIGPRNGARCITIGGDASGNTLNNIKLDSVKISAELSSTGSYSLYLQSSPSVTYGSNKLSNIDISNCEIIKAVNGLKVSDFTQIDGLKITNCKIYDNTDYGVHITTPGIFTNINDFNPEVKNVTINGCEIYNNGNVTSNHLSGALYIEKLKNSTIINSKFTAKILNANILSHLIQLNIKRGDLNGDSINIENCEFIGSGVAGGIASTNKSGGLNVKGRSDGTSYSKDPGYVTNLICKDNKYDNLGMGLIFENNVIDVSGSTTGTIDLGNSLFTNNVMDISNWNTNTNFRINAINSKFSSISSSYAISDTTNITDEQRASLIQKVTDPRTILRTNYLYVNNSMAIVSGVGPIQQGINISKTNEIIYASAGSYSSTRLNINKSVILRGNNYNMPSAIGDGILQTRNAETILTFNGDDNTIWILQSNIVIEGFTLQNGSRVIRDNSSTEFNNVIIRNNIIRNTATSGVTEMLQFFGSGNRNNWQFKNNRFEGNYGNGTILFTNKFTNVVIENNDFMGFGNRYLFGSPVNMTLKNNYFSENSNTLINMNGLSNPVIENNICRVNTFGLQLTTTNGGVVKNNTIIGVTPGNISGLWYFRGIDIFGTAFSGPNSNGLIIENNTFTNFTTQQTINNDDQYRGIHLRQGNEGVTIRNNTFKNCHTAVGVVASNPQVNNINVEHNDVSSTTYTINNLSNNDIILNCNWFGTINISDIKNKFLGKYIINSFLKTDDLENGECIDVVNANESNNLMVTIEQAVNSGATQFVYSLGNNDAQAYIDDTNKIIVELDNSVNTYINTLQTINNKILIFKSIDNVITMTY